MPYGDDVSEGLPFVLSNPAGSIAYTADGYAYDVAIAGLPFFISPLDESPYLQSWCTESAVTHLGQAQRT